MRSHMNRSCQWCCLMAWMWSVMPTLALAEPPPIQCELKKPGDTAMLIEEAGRTVVLVTSHTGIGQMTLSLKQGRWPKDVTLRLRYANSRPFTTLEGFDMTTSRIKVKASSGQSGKTPLLLPDDEGVFSNNDADPAGWLKIEFKPKGDDLDVIFPSHLWRDEKKIAIQWIDFYRG